MVNDLLSGQTLADVEGHQDVVMAAEFSTCGNYLVTGSRDNIARLYKIEYIDGDGGLDYVMQFNQIARLKGHESWVTSVAISADSK